MAMCLVLGQSFGAIANLIAPRLFSKMMQQTMSIINGILTPQDVTLLVSCMIKITSQRAVNRAIYSALVDSKAMIGCLEDQQIGQLAKVMKNPILKRQEMWLSAISGAKPPTKSLVQQDHNLQGKLLNEQIEAVRECLQIVVQTEREFFDQQQQQQKAN